MQLLTNFKIGCGGGEFVRDFIQMYCKKVDVFDRNATALVATLMANSSPISKPVRDGPRRLEKPYMGIQEQSTVEKYEFKHDYDIIFMRWVGNYINDKDLIEFLKRA